MEAYVLEEYVDRGDGPGRRWKRVGWLIAMAVSFVVVWLATGQLAGWLHLPPLWGAALLQLSILVVFIIFAFADGDGMHSFGLTNAWKGYDAGIIVGVIAVHVLGSLLTAQVLEKMGLIKMDGTAAAHLLKAFGDYDAGTFLLIALLLAVMAGVGEELLFRGYLITRLEKLGIGAWGSILISALIFGLVHWPGYGLPLALSKAVWFGIPTGIAFWYRRNLGPLIVAHALVDFLGFTFAFVIAKYAPHLTGM
jgi:membrane protease YdiL (CAAX protease family)